MKRLLIICCAGLLPAAGYAAPQAISPHPKTAGDLAELCGVKPGSNGADAKINYCHGLAQGAISVWRAEGHDKGKFCIPNPASRTETMNAFVNWARALPANRDMLVLSGLFKFMTERFPCK